MPWTELADLRNRSSRQYQDDANPLKRAWSGTLAALHYESDLDSGIYDAEVDATPQRIDNPMFDGWRVTANGWHYALGKDLESHGEQDGWLGFGGRQGAHWFKFRLLRVGYLHWPTRAWDDIGGAPTYDRANLNQETRTLTLGPNADQVNVETVATWSNAWTTPGGGVLDISWKTRGSDLKEEITINQAGREWIAANRPPSTPLDETWFGFVFRLDWSDIPKVVRNGIAQDIDGDFADDDHAIELRDALDRLLAFMPIGHVTAGTPERGQDPAEYQAPLRKRFWAENGNHYLLLGVRCDTLNTLPVGDLVFDPTVNEQVGANADDGYEEGGEWYVSGYSNVNYVGLYASASLYGGMRFQTVNVPQGSTITTAPLQVYSQEADIAGDEAVHLKIYGDDVDDAPEWAADDRPSQITQTTAAVDWDGDSGDWNASQPQWESAPDAKTIIQELVDRPSWSANNDLRLAIFDDGTTNNNDFAWADYNGNASLAPKLDIEYVGAGQPINLRATTVPHLRQWHPRVAS